MPVGNLPTHHRYQLCAAVAVRQAMRGGELIPDAPRDELVLLVTCLMRFAGELTANANGFEQVERHYAATRRAIGLAYGTELWQAALAQGMEDPAKMAGTSPIPASYPLPAPLAPSGAGPRGSGRRNRPAPGTR